MPRLSEYFRSVEGVWLAWAVSVALLAVLAWRAFRGFRWQNLRALHSEEDGAAYSLVYVLTVPFFMLLVCLVIQTTLILIVKMGTLYAAYAAARSGVVWGTADGGDEMVQLTVGRAHEEARLAAVHAVTPFASSSALHATGNRVGQATEGADAYAQAYRTFVNGPASPDYLRAKYLYADKATSVEFSKTSPDADGDLTATVTYHMPLIIPGIARWFGKPSPWDKRFYTVEIVSKVALPDEAPQSDNHVLGINYGPP